MSGRKDKLDPRVRSQRLASRFDRDRKGQRAFSLRQVLARWKRIRDGALVWLEDAVITGRSAGVGTAQLLAEKAEQQIYLIEQQLAEGKSGRPSGDMMFQLRVNGIRLKDLEFGRVPPDEE